MWSQDVFLKTVPARPKIQLGLEDVKSRRR